ncbi:hypothetical protein BDZ89DRAFT_943764, partial [Hymenopellis radicata]
MYVCNIPSSSKTNTLNLGPEIALIAKVQKVTLMELHHICGHRDPASLRRMYIDGHIEGIKLDLNSKAKFCETCARAKAKHNPFPKEGHYEYVQGAGDKVVTDLIGPMDVKSLGGARYACTFRD